MAILEFWSIQDFIDKSTWANHPKHLEQWYGIFTSHFFHSDWKHLVNNAVPLFVLGIGIRHFFKEIFWLIYFYAIPIIGLWVWVFARPSYHLGASGIVYALAAFLFTSGIIRRYPQMYALSLLVIFLYGSMIWGIFPIEHGISWESHLMGLISGIMLAFYFRKSGPQRKLYSWELESEDESVMEDTDLATNENSDFPQDTSEGNVQINYHYKETDRNRPGESRDTSY
jgi:membrane associated rhomboid family serine protease